MKTKEPNTKRKSKPESQTLFTAGYEGRTPEQLVDLLLKNRIDVLVDVRQRASSRKKGFSKTALSEALSNAGIRYHHMPQLGTPSDLRKQLRAGELKLAPYLNQYRRHLNQQGDQLSELEQLVEANRCSLFCVEADPTECHRAVLAELLVERSGGKLNVQHL